MAKQANRGEKVETTISQATYARFQRDNDKAGVTEAHAIRALILLRNKYGYKQLQQVLSGEMGMHEINELSDIILP